MVVFNSHSKRRRPQWITTIGLDLAKNVFQAHGADACGAVVFRKQLRRDKVLHFLAGYSPCTVAMEACGGAHHWAREIGKLGHTVKLIRPEKRLVTGFYTYPEPTP